ncbi:carbon-nitrogen hydrolase family protein [Alphaproteobacteria bacterium]|nr:carbon-nitrogen hydrolase family protein [Alphaproteobacteria bacterium]
MKISCLQICPKPTIEEALIEAIELAIIAVKENADFLFLPEYCGGLVSKGAKYLPPSMNENNHIFLKEFQNFCLNNSIWCLIGSIAVNSVNNKIFNRSYVIDNKGNINSYYDKIHMFDICVNGEEHKESETIHPGVNAVIANTEFCKIGLSVCYDLRFPSLYRSLSLNGAEVLAIPAAFTKKTGEAHWHILNKARAIENCAYVIAPCSIGEIRGGGESYGHSLIIDPWGTIITDGGNSRGVISAVIDISKVKTVRDQLPSLYHDRKYTIQI